MSRFSAVRPALFTALGVAAVLVSPVTAHAITRAPAAIAHASAAPTGAGGNLEHVFRGITFPDTPAGGAACESLGDYLVSDPGSDVLGFTCTLNTPDAGLYNLWETIFIGSCRFCIQVLPAQDSSTAASVRT
jgi:hypothetical protein